MFEEELLEPIQKLERIAVIINGFYSSLKDDTPGIMSPYEALADINEIVKVINI